MMRNQNKNGNAVFYITAGTSGRIFGGNVAVRSLRWKDDAKISKLLGYRYNIPFKSESFVPDDKDEPGSYLVLTDPRASRPYPAIIILKVLEVDDEEIMIDVNAKEDKGFVEFAIGMYMTSLQDDKAVDKKERICV